MFQSPQVILSTDVPATATDTNSDATAIETTDFKVFMLSVPSFSKIDLPVYVINTAVLIPFAVFNTRHTGPDKVRPPDQ
jgi:hypothetical protein